MDDGTKDDTHTRIVPSAVCVVGAVAHAAALQALYRVALLVAITRERSEHLYV